MAGIINTKSKPLKSYRVEQTSHEEHKTKCCEVNLYDIDAALVFILPTVSQLPCTYVCN